MLRSKRDKISNRAILRAFLASPSDEEQQPKKKQVISPFGANTPRIVAYYLIIEKGDDENDVGKIEYMNAEQLENFLSYRTKCSLGLLQKYVECKGEKNRVFRVSWSAKFCWTEVATNVSKLNNDKIPLVDRLVTFEGPEHLSTQTAVNSEVLKLQLKTTCENIVDHFSDVSNGLYKIKRMVSYV
jgi:hypothetical protein